MCGDRHLHIAITLDQQKRPQGESPNTIQLGFFLRQFSANFANYERFANFRQIFAKSAKVA